MINKAQIRQIKWGSVYAVFGQMDEAVSNTTNLKPKLKTWRHCLEIEVARMSIVTKYAAKESTLKCGHHTNITWLYLSILYLKIYIVFVFYNCLLALSMSVLSLDAIWIRCLHSYVCFLHAFQPSILLFHVYFQH